MLLDWLVIWLLVTIHFFCIQHGGDFYTLVPQIQKRSQNLEIVNVSDLLDWLSFFYLLEREVGRDWWFLDSIRLIILFSFDNQNISEAPTEGKPNTTEAYKETRRVVKEKKTKERNE